MANFYGTARSNYFRVKDGALFRAYILPMQSLNLITQKVKGETLFGIISTCDDTGTFPSSLYNEETGEDTEIDLIAGIAAHLCPGEVCVLMEAGAEKLRYISGWAQAFDHTGEVVTVSLSDIYKLAKAKFNVEPTAAEY